MVFNAKIWLNKKQWFETIIWLISTLAGSLLPLYGSLILLYLFSQKIQWTDFLRHGEFTLYSASIITPAIYLILKENFKIPLLRRNFWGIIAVGLLVLSALIFAGVTAVRVNSSIREAIILNEPFLIKSSIIVFCLSVCLSFFVTLGDNLLRIDQNLQLEERKSIKKLEKDFDSLGATNE